MSRDYNKVILMGNFAQDPEYKEIQGGKKVANFVIAVNRTWTGPQGEAGSEVSFIDCEIWGGAAKTIADHFTKGRPIFLDGRLKQEKWTDKESGKNQSRIRVVVENFNFVDSKKANEGVPAIAGNDTPASTEEFDSI
ncbi:MAG: single-stranded DNA-binding protein [Candidatus Asgardarchaeia archaeon]